MKEWYLLLRGGNLVSLTALTFTSCDKCLINHGFHRDFPSDSIRLHSGPTDHVLWLVYVYNKDLSEQFKQT